MSRQPKDRALLDQQSLTFPGGDDGVEDGGEHNLSYESRRAELEDGFHVSATQGPTALKRQASTCKPRHSADSTVARVP